MAKDLVGGIDIPPDAFEVPPHIAPGVDQFSKRNAVSAMLASERQKARKTHHVWDEEKRRELRSANDLPIPTDKRNKKSGFDRRLPFKGPYFGYWIQNRKIYRGMTQIVRLEDVPEEARDLRVPKGYEPMTVKLREMIALALAISDQETLDADPLRCKVCIEFRGQSDIDLMAHFRKEHPTELDQLVEGIERMRAEDETEAEEAPAPPQRTRKQTFRASQ